MALITSQGSASGVVHPLGKPSGPSWLEEIGYFSDGEVPFLRILDIGTPGFGKTHLMGTFPGLVVLDFDKGGITLRRMQEESGSVIGRIPCLESDGVVNRVFQIIDAALAKRGPFAPDGAFSWCQTVGFDSISAFSSSALNDRLLNAKKDPFEEKAGYDEYGQLKSVQVELGKRFKRLSEIYNVFVTGVPDVDKDKNTGGSYGTVDVVGSYRSLVLADFDEVYIAGREVDATNGSYKYNIQTGKVGLFEGKSRLGLPLKIEDPSYEKIISGLKKRETA